MSWKKENHRRLSRDISDLDLEGPCLRKCLPDMPLKSAVRRWCWTDGTERMNPQECFSDGTLCWGTLGETGSSRLQVAWKYGLPLGGDITVTTSPMVAVKWKLIAMLPEGMLFQRKTLKRVWVWATPWVCKAIILQVDVRPNELNFSRLSGVEAATMPVTDGTTKWMDVVEFLMKALKVPSEFHFKLVVDGKVVGPRNQNTLVHVPLMDEDQIPMPAPIPLTKPVNWTQRNEKAPRRYREEFLRQEMQTSDEEDFQEALQAAADDNAPAASSGAAASTGSSSTTDSEKTLLLGDPPRRRITKKRPHHDMD